MRELVPTFLLTITHFTTSAHTTACLRIYLNAISRRAESSPLWRLQARLLYGREIANSLTVRRMNRFSRSLGTELFAMPRVSFCPRNERASQQFLSLSLFLSSLSLTFAPFHLFHPSSGLFRLFGYLTPSLSPSLSRALKRMNLFARTVATGESFTRISTPVLDIIFISPLSFFSFLLRWQLMFDFPRSRKDLA